MYIAQYIRKLCLFSIFFFYLSSSSWAGIDLGVYGELPLNAALHIPLDKGTGPAHGIVYFQYTDTQHVGSGNHLRAGLNTDTFWLAWDIGKSSQRPFVFSPYIKAQFGFGEMTPDYIAQGQHIESLSFLSSYVEWGFDWQYKLHPTLALEGLLNIRYAFFGHRGPSEKARFQLPNAGFGLQAQLRLNWDQMDRNIAHGKLHKGLRARFIGQVRERWNRHPWGGYQTAHKDTRNQTQSAFPTLQMMLLFEWSHMLHQQWTVALQTSAGISWFADDLHRFKIGGDNPFIPSLSGTYFAEFVVDAYWLSHFKLTWLATHWLRLTPQFDWAWLPDILRTGTSDSRWVVGIGMTFDFFIQDSMRFVLKLSYSPNAPRPENTGSFKVFVGYVAKWW